ncbi:ATP-binding protein [Tessaracoccus antarcticus]|uniref:histidine kinase n=1 Tax=Tessaracoccus antarcticus TaxID=2479848 RepID=A0A3M0G8W2_9ACTN|nr:ATP-binding protein [Tessaracoccus antarcticus]RMB61354.1 HAMP domain-containing protein [Tessaracoccus antarcticus]
MSAPGRRWGGLSLRLRLTLVTAGLLCLGLILGAVALTAVVSASRISVLDEVALERASTVARLAEEDRLPEPLPVAEPGEIAQVLDGTGLVVESSANASRTLPLLAADQVARLRGDGPATLATAYDDQARLVARAATWRGQQVTVVVSLPLRDVEGVLHALRVSLVGVVPTLTVLLALVIWLALGRALAPVEQLRKAAASVAREGGPGALPVPNADDELGALARTLNEMLDRLERAAVRQRSFVEDAAHELRSPISVLRATVEVARSHPDALSTAELAADLEPEVLRMQSLVDDLLLLARLGAAPVQRIPQDLGTIVGDGVSAARAGVSVEVRGNGVAYADPSSIGRVVRNLVDNATRHALTRVRVTISDGRVVVEDDGAGIAEQDRERVFERFVRLEEARDREAGGSGLGLAIVREIARDHGGDVVLGESDLGGLSATLVLPVEGPRGVGQPALRV